MRDDQAEVGRRVAHWLRQVYPRHAAKLLVTDLGLTSDIAERALQGRVAQPAINRMIRQWGQSFRDFIYEPLCSGVPASVERQFWITTDDIKPALAGLDIAARDGLGLPATSTADHAEFVRRNFGWIALRAGIGHAALLFHDAVDPRALARAQEWIAEHGRALRAVTLNGQVTTPEEAIAELGRRATIERAHNAALDHGWQIKRAGLSEISSEGLTRLVTARAKLGDTPGTLPRLLYDTGLLGCSAIFTKYKDGRIRSDWAGPALGVKAEDVVGRELSERPDRRYSDLLRSHLLQATEAPTFHRLRLFTLGKWWRYDRVAQADRPTADGRQTIATTVNILDEVAA